VRASRLERCGRRGGLPRGVRSDQVEVPVTGGARAPPQVFNDLASQPRRSTGPKLERRRCSAAAREGRGASRSQVLTTLNGGSLGTWVDEERCKMRVDV
jgi:hypothetical protein